MGICGSKKEPRPDPYDFYRNSALRYFGYAGHIGSACCLIVPCNVSNYMRMAATTYVMADVFSKSMLSAQKQQSPKKVAITAGDALVWQLLASVLFPGLIIQGVKYGTLALLGTNKEAVQKAMKSPCGPPPPRGMPLILVRALPCLLGLLILPLISSPIDKFTTELMNGTYRKSFTDEEDGLTEEEKKLRRQFKDMIQAIKKEICKVDKELKELKGIEADWDKQDKDEYDRLMKLKEKLLCNIEKTEKELLDKLKASKDKREKEIADKLKKELDQLEKELEEKKKRSEARAKAKAKKAEAEKKGKDCDDKFKKEQEQAKKEAERIKKEQEDCAKRQKDAERQRKEAEQQKKEAEKKAQEEAERRKKEQREAELTKALAEKKKREC